MTARELRELLVQNGYKVTKQREIIFQVLSENEGNHLSPEELHFLVSAIDDQIGIATVYRTLVIFENLDVVSKLDFDDNRYRYELRDDDKHQHHHLLCKSCGKIIEVEEEDYLNCLEEVIKKRYKFSISTLDLKFYGKCSECSEKEQK